MVTWVLTTIDDGNIVCENLWWYYTEMKYVWIDWLKIVLKMVTNTLGIDMYKNDINHYKNTKHKQHLVKNIQLTQRCIHRDKHLILTCVLLLPRQDFLCSRSNGIRIYVKKSVFEALFVLKCVSSIQFHLLVFLNPQQQKYTPAV